MIASAGQALAQDCELSLSRSDIDYGLLNRTTLKAVAGVVNLPVRSVQLSVQCPTEQAMRLSYQALASGIGGYRFGEQGDYQLWLGDAQLDDRAVQLGQVSGAGLGISASAREMPLLPEQALVPTQGGQALTGQRWVARVEVRSRGPDAALRAPQSSHWAALGRFVGNGAQHQLSLQVGFTPASCTPRLGQGGVVDFGRIGAGQLAPQRTTVFQRELALSIQCDGPTRFALTAHDNRAGTALALAEHSAAFVFGLGNSRAGAVLGGFRLRIQAPVSEGPVLPLSAAPAALSWRSVGVDDAALAHDGRLLGFAREGDGLGSPGALADLTARLQVELHLAPLQALKLNEEIPIQGSATLEIIYL
jgi:hypothetical protein